MFMCFLILLTFLYPTFNREIRTKYYKNEINVEDLKEMDAIGAFTNIVDNVLQQQNLGNSRPREQLCKTYWMRVAGVHIKLSGQPRGSCTYCCPIVHPKKYIKLYFTNKSLRENMVELKLVNDRGSLQAVGVKNNIPTIIFFHGFTEHGLGPLPMEVRDAYLSRPEEHNIIIGDWGELSAFPWYPHAVQNVKLAAKVVSDFIAFYDDTGELPISQLHVIGFSLGAHLAGFVGKNLKAKQKVPRITGLDPAGPLYPIQDTTQRLSKHDAEYVDIIHTDGGKFGIPVSLGHADFYPNGGTYMQPGCTSSYLAENRTIESFGTCSHTRAVHLYTESVRNPEAFPSFKCAVRCKRQENAYMGFRASRKTTAGNFYLVTNEGHPFGRNI